MKVPKKAHIDAVYLLEYPVEWEDGMGRTLHHVAFADYATAIEAGHDQIREVFKEDNEEEMKRNFSIFDHQRSMDDVLHHCGGVNLKIIPLIKS